jgi:hypothetical protein
MYDTRHGKRLAQLLARLGEKPVREGDIHEWFVDAIRRPPDTRAAGLIRAKYTRRLAQRTGHRYLWTAMHAAPPLGRLTFAFARTSERPPRQLTVTVTAKQVTLQKERVPYHDIGAAEYNKRFRERELHYLQKKATKLGYKLSPA